ncbi:MAG TPA: hypothetical protein DCM64_10755 [Gammaproteobacteria bacterium]|nr:hypothetical protein [Gammaproteobacteria bacterium]MDP6732845.1 hypothetical protein [Gammaproteobacteria bacterium]HAJ76922.1 hypothetical protein [Gammaproteobacteria bacterium]
MTPGGNESNEEDGTMGAPYYSTAQDIPSTYTDLLGSSVTTPVIIHPAMGIPDTGGWITVREAFGLAEKFAYKNTSITSYEEGQTSLISSQLVDSNGDPIVDSAGDVITSPILPATEMVVGRDTRIHPFIRGSFGQAANLIDSSELPAANIFYSGTMLVNSHDDDGSNLQSQSFTVPYLISNGEGKFLVNISQPHSELFTWMITSAIADATGAESTLATPAPVQMRGGTQTMAIAYDETDLQFNMPVAAGTQVRIRIYDYLGELSSDETIDYSSTITRNLQKRSLLVAEAISSSAFSVSDSYLYIPGVEAAGLGTFDLSMTLVTVDGELQLQLESAAASSFSGTGNSVDLNTGILVIPSMDLVDSSGAVSTYNLQLQLVPESNPVRLRIVSATQ